MAPLRDEFRTKYIFKWWEPKQFQSMRKPHESTKIHMTRNEEILSIEIVISRASRKLVWIYNSLKQKSHWDFSTIFFFL